MSSITFKLIFAQQSPEMLHSVLCLDTFSNTSMFRNEGECTLHNQKLMTHLVLLVLIGHGERLVHQLIWLGLLWLHTEGDWATPVLPFNDGCQLPVLVGAVGDGDHLDIPTPHLCGEVLHLLDGGNACTASCQRQRHWLVGPTIQETSQFLEEGIEKHPLEHFQTNSDCCQS